MSEANQQSLDEIRAQLRAALRPYLFITGRTFSGQTFNLTAANGHRVYVFHKEADGRMIYRFASIADFEAEQASIIRGARTVKLGFGVDIEIPESAMVEVREKQPEPDLDPAPETTPSNEEVEPFSPPAEPPLVNPPPTTPPPVLSPEEQEQELNRMLWQEQRDAEREKLSRTSGRRLQEIAAHLSVARFGPKADLVEAILVSRFGTEPGAKFPAPEAEMPAAETVEVAAPDEVATPPNASYTPDQLMNMSADEIRALGAAKGFTGSRKQIIDALLKG